MALRSTPLIAVVGCGPWGKNLATAFAQEGALRMLVDVVPLQAHALATSLSDQGYDKPTVCTWEDALNDELIDAIALATPAIMHANMAIASMTAGKHVYIEKPFALSVNDGERIIEVAKAQNKLVMVGHLFQYHPAYVKLKDMVHKGELGCIQHIHSRRFGFGRIRQEEDVFWNLGSHDISMILGLAGEMPVEVTANGFHHLRSHIADIATAELSFASGVQAHVLVSWLFPQKERKLIVVGDLATAVFDDCELSEKKLCVFRNRVSWHGEVPETVREGSEALPLGDEQPLALECQHFIDCLRSGQQPVTNVEEAQRVVTVLSRIEKQIRPNIFESGSSPTNGLEPVHEMSSPPPVFGETPCPHVRCYNGEQKNATVLGTVSTNQAMAPCNDLGDKSPSQIPLVDLRSQRSRIQSQLDSRLHKVFDHSKFVLGPEVHELEARLCEYTGSAYTVTCGSGTGALTLALLALGLQAGDAVLVPDLSFVATVEPVVLLGGIPIFVDVEPQYLTINASLVHEGVAAATKAGYTAVGIIAVDLYGHPADYDALNEAAAVHNLWVIGDAAQSFGGSLHDRRVGSLARLTTTSFFPSKPLGCYGDGGAIFTNDVELANVLKSLRQHGLDDTKSVGLRIGLNSRLDTIQAAVLLCKLDLHAQEILQRERVAKRYTQLLHEPFTLPTTRCDTRPAWAAYTVRTKHRDMVRQYLSDKGISSAVYYAVPFHQQPAYKQFPTIEGSCPVAEQACKEVLSLPMGPYLDLAAQTHIANTMLKALVDHYEESY
jgi:dTDP-4-amino-4,6-dideoxygalactose transaminase/predicted dehydrogenase